MSFKAYDEYKNSGVEWLGEIPTHWVVSRLKNKLELITDRATKRTNPIALENIEGWSGKFLANETDYSGEGIAFQENDILFGKLRPYLAKVFLPKYSGEAIGDFHVLRKKNNVDTKYIAHQFLMPEFISVIDGATHGAKMPRVGWEVMGNMPLVVPSEKEQTIIAAFLDHETARIDALIEEQQRLITLLKEKRQAVISHAVTKGLDPNVPMKDSGVEWLGDVPAHWNIAPFSYAIDYQEGPGIMANDFHDTGVPLIRISGVNGAWVSLNGCNYLAQNKANTKWGHFKLKKEDLLISGSASMGLVSEVGLEATGAIAYTGLIRLRAITGKTTKDFIKSFVASDLFFTQINLLKTGSTIQHFGPYHLSQMYLALPPISEQKKLAKHIKDTIQNYDEMISQANGGNILLQERRSALISAAVTGKIDVRDWQPPKASQTASESVEVSA